jgi:hypothetical protein
MFGCEPCVPGEDDRLRRSGTGRMGAPRAVVQARNALRSKPTLRAPELVRARCPHPPRPWQNQTGSFSSPLELKPAYLFFETLGTI